MPGAQDERSLLMCASQRRCSRLQHHEVTQEVFQARACTAHQFSVAAAADHGRALGRVGVHVLRAGRRYTVRDWAAVRHLSRAQRARAHTCHNADEPQCRLAVKQATADRKCGMRNAVGSFCWYATACNAALRSSGMVSRGWAGADDVSGDRARDCSY